MYEKRLRMESKIYYFIIHHFIYNLHNYVILFVNTLNRYDILLRHISKLKKNFGDLNSMLQLC